MVLPPDLAGPLAEQKRLDDLTCPTIPQLAFADMLGRGEYDRHLRRSRLLYRRRRDALLAALAEHMPEARPAGVAAGIHLSAYLADAPARQRSPARPRCCWATRGWRRRRWRGGSASWRRAEL